GIHGYVVVAQKLVELVANGRDERQVLHAHRTALRGFEPKFIGYEEPLLERGQLEHVLIRLAWLHDVTVLVAKDFAVLVRPYGSGALCDEVGRLKIHRLLEPVVVPGEQRPVAAL